MNSLKREISRRTPALPALFGCLHVGLHHLLVRYILLILGIPHLWFFYVLFRSPTVNNTHSVACVSQGTRLVQKGIRCFVFQKRDNGWGFLGDAMKDFISFLTLLSLFCTRTKIQCIIWSTGDHFVLPWSFRRGHDNLLCIVPILMDFIIMKG